MYLGISSVEAETPQILSEPLQTFQPNKVQMGNNTFVKRGTTFCREDDMAKRPYIPPKKKKKLKKWGQDYPANVNWNGVVGVFKIFRDTWNERGEKSQSHSQVSGSAQPVYTAGGNLGYEQIF